MAMVQPRQFETNRLSNWYFSADDDNLLFGFLDAERRLVDGLIVALMRTLIDSALTLVATQIFRKQKGFCNVLHRHSALPALMLHAAVFAPPGEAHSDFDIFLAIADLLGVREGLYPGWSTMHDAYKEWQLVSAGRAFDYSAISLERMESEGGVQCGGERLYADGTFAFVSGRARLHCVSCLPFLEQPNEEFNLILGALEDDSAEHVERLETASGKLSDELDWLCHYGSGGDGHDARGLTRLDENMVVLID